MLVVPRLAPFLLFAAVLSAATDDVIVPGLRVGPVTRTSTEQSLLRSLGKSAMKAEIDVGEGMTERGLIIYEDDPARRLAVTWDHGRPAHPALVFICYQRLNSPCRWRTASGIGIGLTLKDLERHNSRPFELTGAGTDVSGNGVSFNGGRLARELDNPKRLLLTFDVNGPANRNISAEEYDTIQGGGVFLSSLPAFQKLNPRVIAMGLYLSFP